MGGSILSSHPSHGEKEGDPELNLNGSNGSQREPLPKEIDPYRRDALKKAGKTWHDRGEPQI